MKKYILPIILCFVSASYTFAEPADYKLEVKDFAKLKVTDNINVEYICSSDSAGWVYFTCDPSISSRLIFSNNKSCLHIQVSSDDEILTGLPTLRVYSSYLTKAENDSDSTLRVLSNAPVPNFKCRVVGNGTIIVNNVDANSVEAAITTGKGHIVIVNGKSQKAKLTNVGTGPIEAGALKARNVKVTLFGTGDIDCTATESISIYGAGSGKVYYGGNPEKVSNRSLGVKAFPVNKE